MTNVTQVERADNGVVVAFTGRVKMLKEVRRAEQGNYYVDLVFRDGNVAHYELPDTLTADLALYGLERRFNDAISAANSPQEIAEATQVLAEQLATGQFVVARKKKAKASLLVRAVAQLYGKTEEAIEKFLAGKTRQERAAIKSNPKVKGVMAKLEEEESGEVKNSDDLLSELSVD